MRYEDTKIRKLFKEDFGGWGRIVKSLDFRVSTAFTVLLIALALSQSLVPAVVPLMLPVFIMAAPALIAVSIAGLAIVVALSDPKFIKILVEEGVFSNILLLYLIPAFSAGLAAFVGIIGLLLNQSTESLVVMTPVLFFATLLFTYSLTGVISAVGTTLRYGMYRAEFIRRGLL